MKYPAYQKYKESGVVWLGEVPKHWEVKSARLCYSIQLGKMLQPEASNSNDQEVPYLKSQHVQWESVRTDDLPTMWASTLDEVKYGVADGDLLVCEGGDVGRAGIVENPQPRTIIQNALHRVRSNKNDLRFLMFILEHAASQKWFEILCNRSTIAHFTSEKFGALRLPLPEISEQTAIADFLDRETGRIDTLVAKKRALIALLKEKRTALISRTVTRGLPAEVANEFGFEPHTRFKDSGIEWLGEVPEGWEIKKLSWLFNYSKGRNAAVLTKEYIGANLGDYPVFSGQTENNGLMGMIDAFEFEFESPVIFVTTVGARAMSTRLVDGKFSLSQNCALIIPRAESIVSSYFLGILQRLFDFERRSISLIMQPSLRFEDLNRFWVPLPPADEQTAIATYLDREITRNDRMVEKVETAIASLQEYRTALITVAVTGKIDVRQGLA
jgi:type I restriction enzyme S subunit